MAQLSRVLIYPSHNHYLHRPLLLIRIEGKLYGRIRIVELYAAQESNEDTTGDILTEEEGDDSDGTPTATEDRIKQLESQTKALEMELSHRSEDNANALAEYNAIRKELADATQKYERERKLYIDIAQSMTRQYKGMQDDLLNKINERERIIESLKDELETLKAMHRKEIAVKDDVIQQKDADAAKKREEVEDLCKHFANLIGEASLRIKGYKE
ncbi:hypothetical protein ACHAXA_003338 [Cyclostephanos tholiformis]|uniref:Dynein regulatory complex protein 12 n=1 Tax=Cyclostephanos tholiformis TaxID=382380 RepID=A0ABD3SBL9_9STRA